MDLYSRRRRRLRAAFLRNNQKRLPFSGGLQHCYSNELNRGRRKQEQQQQQQQSSGNDNGKKLRSQVPPTPLLQGQQQNSTIKSHLADLASPTLHN